MLLKSLLCAVLMLCSGRSALADWLIMRDGSKLATRGPWEVQGKRVVLVTQAGTFASIATSEVDVERSLDASGLAADANTLPATPLAREPVLVLTNRDLPTSAPMNKSIVSHLPDPPSQESEPRVEFWVELEAPGIDGIEFLGRLHNPTAATALVSGIEVEIVDSHGSILRQKASFRRPVLAAGRSTSFRARFPDLTHERRGPAFTVFTDRAPRGTARRSADLLRGPSRGPQ